jgi:hypothetical protein
MEYQTLVINNKEVFVQSKNATESFELYSLDIEFIEEDILDNNAIQGELEVIVNEGLIEIEWQVLKGENNE